MTRKDHMEHIRTFQQKSVGRDDAENVEWAYTKWMSENRKVKIVERVVTVVYVPPTPGVKSESGGLLTQITVFYTTTD